MRHTGYFSRRGSGWGRALFLRQGRRMMLSRRQVVICLSLALASGCARWQKEPMGDPVQLLRPAAASPESVTLEIFFVRAPWADPQLNGPLWERIDEQHFPAELRRRLAGNGLRAGLIGGQVPAELAAFMHLTDKQQPQKLEQRDVSLEAEPDVRRRLLQLRSGRRGEILASDIYPSLPLLISDAGQVRGRTYEKAQGLFAILATPQPDRRVELILTPELHYGEARQQWSGSTRDGILQLKMARPKETFADLELKTLLAPGQMLILSCLPDRPGSLGYHFFHDESGRGEEQKVLVVRLVKTPPGELYEAEGRSQ
jgi:hypothetical protein